MDSLTESTVSPVVGTASHLFSYGSLEVVSRVVLVFETRSNVAQADLKLTVPPRMTLNFSCLDDR